MVSLGNSSEVVGANNSAMPMLDATSIDECDLAIHEALQPLIQGQTLADRTGGN